MAAAEVADEVFSEDKIVKGWAVSLERNGKCEIERSFRALEEAKGQFGTCLFAYASRDPVVGRFVYVLDRWDGSENLNFSTTIDGDTISIWGRLVMVTSTDPILQVCAGHFIPVKSAHKS